MKVIYRIIFVLGFFVFTSFSSFATLDSLGIKVQDGEKFIMHRVDKGQTLYAISRKYGVSVEQLKETNPQAKKQLVVGEILLVPYEKKIGKYHTVKDGETLFSISQKYGVEVKQIKKWNDLKSNSIEIGQKLKVGKEGKGDTKKKPSSDDKNIKGDKTLKNDQPDEKGKGSKSSKNKKKETEAQDSVKKVTKDKKQRNLSELGKKYQKKSKTNSQGIVSKNQEGKATWLKNASIETRKCLGLHRSAPPGTIIKVTNLMNDSVVYVKTVGMLNKNEEEEILITISEKAAKKLNVTEDYFRARLEYSYEKPSN